MTTKQTDRVLIKAYGDKGIVLFNEIEDLLNTLMNQLNDVEYEGQNAFDFKTKATKNAEGFANVCRTNMTEMSATVTDACTGIAKALGGEKITLEAPDKKFVAPDVNPDVSVESATEGPLRKLAADVIKTFGTIEDSFNENLTNFRNLGEEGWKGPEYESALVDLAGINNTTLTAIENSRSVISGDINSQLDALGFGSA